MNESLRPLLDWVLARFPQTPRTRAKQWIEAGRIRVGNRILRKATELIPDPGDSLQLLGRQAGALECDPPWRLHRQLELLYLDASLAVVNKAPGLLSVPAGDRRPSALGILADYLAGKYRPRHAGAVPPSLRQRRPLPVHRLDRDTSGLLCFAMNPRARENLIAQFRERKAGRQYLAFVEGRPPTDRGTWRHQLALSADGQTQRVVKPASKPRPAGRTAEAVTQYEVLAWYTWRNRPVTKLRLRLDSGLRHQIRIQAAAEGVPILGDTTYRSSGGGAKTEARSPVWPVARQALHAESLTLEHPDRPGVRLTWNAPLPPDLTALESALRSSSSA